MPDFVSVPMATLVLSEASLVAALASPADEGGVIFVSPQVGEVALDTGLLNAMRGPLLLQSLDSQPLPADTAGSDVAETRVVLDGPDGLAEALSTLTAAGGGTLEIPPSAGTVSIDFAALSATGVPVVVALGPAPAPSAPLPVPDTFVVSSAAEVVEAVQTLARNDGGTILLSGDADPYDIGLFKLGSTAAPITIAALPGETAPVIASMDLNKCRGLTVTGLDFRSSGVDGQKDIVVQGCQDISFIDNTMEGTADGFLREGGDVDAADSMLFIRGSRGIVFADNTVSGYFGGIGMLDVHDVEISGNEFSNLQGDGIQGRAWDNVRITDNYIHDFYGSTQSYNHTDMIQIFGLYAEFRSRDVVISGNVLSSGNGAATQGIMIQNEDMGTGRIGDGRYENFTITNNLVYNGAPNGILAVHIDGLNLSHNTVLQDPDAQTEGAPGKISKSAVPWILTGSSTDITVENNLSGAYALSRVSASEAENVKNNVLLDYFDRASDTYAYDHITNLLGSGEIDPRDLMLRSDSDLQDYGAHIDLSIMQEDLIPIIVPEISPHDSRAVSLYAEVRDPAGAWVDVEDLVIRWSFSDGTVIRGDSALRVFDEIGTQTVRMEVFDTCGITLAEVEREVTIANPLLAELDFETGVRDVSGRGSPVRLRGATPSEALVDTPDGTGVHIGHDRVVEFDRSNTHLSNLERFEIDVSLRLDWARSYGDIFTFHQVSQLSVLRDGTLSFKLTTDEGSFTLYSDREIIADRDWHDITVQFDGLEKTLTLVVDGEVAASGHASGMTGAPPPWGPVLGSAWGRTIDAVIEDFSISQPNTEQTTPHDAPAIGPGQVDELLFGFDFDGGRLEDDSRHDTGVSLRGDPGEAFDTRGGAEGLHIDNDTRLEVARTSDQLSGLDAFDINLAIAKDWAGEKGDLLSLHTILDLDVLSGGRLRFWLQTDEGKYYAYSDKGVLADKDWHDIMVSYDGDEKTLSIEMDGQIVAETHAEGTTPDLSYWPMVLGGSWGPATDAMIDNFWMSTPVVDDALAV